MKKYLVFSLCIHLLFFVTFYHYSRPGEEKLQLNKVISVSFVVENVKPSENPGTLNVADRVLEKKENSINEKQKEPQKKEKPKKEEVIKEKTFDSTMATKDAKEVKKEEASASQEKAEGKDTGEESKGNSNPFYGSNFQANGDGSYTALSAEGISYEILNEVEPDYPSQAEAISYEKKVSVKIKFLVGLKGNIENVQIVKSHKQLGFDDEVMKAIKKWRFKPIYHAGHNIKVYFVKEFIFNPR